MLRLFAGVTAAMLAVIAFLAPAARADDTSALINQALDKQIKLTINAVLPQAMKTIEEQTGVPMKADPQVWELLPWGQDTNINAKIENQTLREALDAITRKLGLKAVVKDNTVELQPVPGLRRLANRATVQELQALDALSTLQVSIAGQTTVKQLLDAVDKRLEEAKTPFSIEPPPADTLRGETPLTLARNATCMEALEALDKQTGATWYPWAKRIVILAKQDEVRRLLHRPISVRYNGVDLSQVLVELAQRTGLSFDVEAGAVQQVPPEQRNVRLVLDNATVQDAMEAISGFTGLDFMIREGGIYIWNQAGSVTHREQMWGWFNVPGTDLQMLIPASQVPPDIKEYARVKMIKRFQDIRVMMKEEGFVPSNAPTPSTPTTKPSSKPLPTSPDL